MRLFIGMRVPQDIREGLQIAWSKVKNCPINCRPIDPKNWHFTLAFLGEVKDDKRPALVELVDSAVSNSPKGQFILTDFQTFPAKHPSYVIARAIAEPEDNWDKFIDNLRELVSVVAPQIDRKTWVPHLTIARAKRGLILPTWSQPLDEPLNWRPSEISLVQSQQTQIGSRYTDLHVFPLNI